MPKPITGTGRGAKAKPVERKRAAGNPGKRSLPGAPTPSTALAVVRDGDCPAAPEHLTDVGRATWVYLWNGGRRWMADSQDAIIASLTATKVEELATLRAWLGTDVTRRWYETANGQVVTHPAVKQLEQGEAQLTAWLSILGFSPSDRARLGLAEIRVADALDEYRQRKTQRTKSA